MSIIHIYLKAFFCFVKVSQVLAYLIIPQLNLTAGNLNFKEKTMQHISRNTTN
jgi:hypothetical protein